MRRLVSVSLLTCSLALTAGAQEKLSGTLNCPKPATREMGETGDMPGHVLAFTKNTCSWTAPVSIAGAKGTNAAEVATAEIRGAKQTFHGFNTTTYDNGDKATAEYEGSGTVNADGSGKYSGKWKFIGGSGQLSGIKGSGTFSGDGAADGSTVSNITGHYSLKGGKGKKKAM